MLDYRHELDENLLAAINRYERTHLSKTERRAIQQLRIEYTSASAMTLGPDMNRRRYWWHKTKKIERKIKGLVI